MIYEFKNYREYLRAELVDTIKRNPNYSLRAFAKKLGLAPSTLSEVLKGKKNISREMSFKLSKSLRMDSNETEYFELLVDLETLVSEDRRMETLDRINRLRPSGAVKDLSVDLFKLISDWYHLPILEMTQLRDFKFSPPNISKALGITAIEAEAALERLIRLELLELSESGKYKKTSESLSISSQVSSKALQNFHKQMLEKAITSLSEQSTKEKIVGSETFAFDAKRLPDANEIIESFYKKMVRLADQCEKSKDIYHLTVQFFRLTGVKDHENKNN